MKASDLKSLAQAIELMDKRGLKADRIIVLSTLLKGIAGDPGKIIDLMSEYAGKASYVRDEIKKMDAELADHTANHNVEMIILKKELASIENDVEELREYYTKLSSEIE